MTKFCENCGKEIETSAPFCAYCGAKNGSHGTEAVVSASSRPRINRALRVLLIVTGAIFAFVTLMIVLNANLLLPWQKEARLNKRAILSYVTEHYPDADIIKQQYESLNPNFLKSYSSDYFTFKKDLLEFSIFAKGGEIIIDDYPKEKSIAEFDEIIQDGFLKPRGIVAQTQYRFFGNYEEYPYTGGLGITVRVRDQGTTPQEIGWLYDFYKYWSENGAFLDKYSVFIDIMVDNINLHEVRFTDSDVFTSAEDFYTIFK